MERPFSQSCVNNAEPILGVLQRYLGDAKTCLEIGSGTGQHAVYFAEQFPTLRWQTSDLPENHAGIRVWLEDYPGDNILPPVTVDAAEQPWSVGVMDAVFTANTLHIMSWNDAQRCIAGAAGVLQDRGLLIVYGPFNYGGKFTSDSNARFDQWLKSRAAHSGIRDFEAVLENAEACGLALLEDNAMPANNRCLVFRKSV